MMADYHEPFTLLLHQVPPPPSSGFWIDIHQWCVCAMDPADTRLSFISSCLADALRRNGLTKREAEACGKIFQRALNDYHERTLMSHNSTDEDDSWMVPHLTVVKSED